MMIFNTMTMKKEVLVPRQGNSVNIYACGPTVYNFFHLGNARPFVLFDVLRRVLTDAGYELTFVQNFTDIDDKVIKKANEEGLDFSAIAKRYIDEYFIDADGLGVKRADIHPLATEAMDAILEMINTLIKKGHAYIIPNDGVYFETSTFKNYGSLSHYTMEDLVEGASSRMSQNINKKHPSDFSLWKFKKRGNHFGRLPLVMVGLVGILNVQP